jgi:conjugal transfer pilus assembly protein TraL
MAQAQQIPTEIDISETILFWSADEFFPAVTLFVLGFMIDQILLGIFAGWAVAKLMRKYKDLRPDGFLFHAIYWYGFTGEKGHTIRNPYIEEYHQ